MCRIGTVSRAKLLKGRVAANPNGRSFAPLRMTISKEKLGRRCC